MQMLKTRLWTILVRDAYNVIVAVVPSRRVRRVWLQRLLADVPESVTVCLRVRFLGPKGIKIGSRSVVGSDCILDGRGSLEIGHDVDIAPHVHIWSLEHDPSSPNHGVRERRVKIGDHAWIASRATILPGVCIGRGAVVAAGSIVRKDVEEREIVAGNPAKHIGWRDNPLEYELNFSGRFR